MALSTLEANADDLLSLNYANKQGLVLTGLRKVGLTKDMMLPDSPIENDYAI